ncbi:MAG: N-acetylmuramoyl-L-alanine amidase [Alicyclobacillus sp.]|nr:N-acetylmuramoyl-L-alanine amidase [Alicyclobacillus sp.]
MHTFQCIRRWLATVAVTASLGWAGWVPNARAVEPGLVGRCIVIDAGHGGPDSGARGVGGLHEKDITLPVALRLGGLLQQAGARVYYTRTTDDDLASEEDRRLRRRQHMDLTLRARTAKRVHADAFISIHCNADPGPAWHGAQTLYQRGNPQGEALAKHIQQRYRALLLPTGREADDTSTLFVLKHVPGAAVIAEIGFVSNPEEASALKRPSYQNLVATATYLGVLDYFGEVGSVAPPVPEGARQRP